MTHPAHAWQTGDTISATLLNNLEGRLTDATAAMAALPSKGYVDTADATNAQAIAGLQARTFAPVATTGSYADLSSKPTLATVATTGAYADLTGKPILAAGAGITLSTSGFTTTIAATSTGTSGGGSTNDADFGAVLLDSFQTGSLTDDQLLTAAMSAVGADTYPRTILLTNRLYQFTTGGITPYEGFRLRGAEGFSNPERNSGNKVAAPVSLTMTGPWFTSGSSTIFGCTFENLALEGHGQQSTFLGSGTGTWDCLAVRNIYASGMRTVLGTQANKLLITASSFDGWWELNNSYAGAIHLGGSDNSLLWNQLLLDAAPAFATTGGSSGQAHFWADGLDKTIIGPIYVTAEGVWRGIRHDGSAPNSGSTNTGSCTYLGIRAEGRNPSQPCNGSLIVVNGGVANITGTWVAYGMASPGTGENGVIQHNGGRLFVDGVTYDATNQAQNTSTPFVHTVGGSHVFCGVTRVATGSRGSVTWGANLPIFARATAGAENRLFDITTTQTTV